MDMRILMCRPDYFGVNYEINPWMDVHKQVNRDNAIHQWETLYKTIINCGATVELLDPVPGWPDMVFTANAGLLYQQKAVILSHFKHKERQGEQTYFYNWFDKSGFKVVNPSVDQQPYFEGAGDALHAGDKLFAGYGFRTQREFYEQENYFDHSKLIYCELADPYFYHLDTCFCPLNDHQAIWYPEAFTKESQKNMQEHIELIAVNEEEARRFACNAVVLGKNIILPAECPDISATLEKKGFTVYACEMNEYLKAGGACKCLTLRLD